MRNLIITITLLLSSTIVAQESTYSIGYELSANGNREATLTGYNPLSPKAYMSTFNSYRASSVFSTYRVNMIHYNYKYDEVLTFSAGFTSFQDYTWTLSSNVLSAKVTYKIK